MYGSFLCNIGSYMPKINYITADGERHEIEVDQGYTVMEGAVNNDIDGIPAECGGACACATCHVYVDPEWFNKLPKNLLNEAKRLLPKTNYVGFSVTQGNMYRKKSWSIYKFISLREHSV